MNHIALLGDSVFDNGAYVERQSAVVDLIRAKLPAGWTVSLLAVDGSTADQVFSQMDQLANDVTHMALSVGGNDALGCLDRLKLPASSVMQGLVALSHIQRAFQSSYRSLLVQLLALQRPIVVCTIYDSVPGLPVELQSALSLFNDVILKEAIHHGLTVLDLRAVLTEAGDYSAVSPIEPSVAGGEKLAERLVSMTTGMATHNPKCTVHW